MQDLLQKCDSNRMPRRERQPILEFDVTRAGNDSIELDVFARPCLREKKPETRRKSQFRLEYRTFMRTAGWTIPRIARLISVSLLGSQ